MHMLGELLQQPGELLERILRGQLVKIIEDQERTVVMPGEFRQNSVGDGGFIEVGRRCRLFPLAGPAGSLPDGGEDSKPELLGVLLVAPYLDACQTVLQTRAICPGPQQGSLAATCGSRDKRYLRFSRAIERCEKFPALNQQRSCRTRLSSFCPECNA